MCAINALCFLDYCFYKLVEYGFRKGQVSIWSDLGSGIPHKVYLGSTNWVRKEELERWVYSPTPKAGWIN